MERKWRPTSEVSPDESSDVSDDSDSDLSKHDLTGTASETRESSKKLDPPARVASSSSTHDNPTPSDHGEPPRSWKSSVAPDRTLPTTSVKPVAKIPETRAQPSLSKAALEAEVQKKKKLIGTLNLKFLPDKGARLKDQLGQLEEQLASLRLASAVSSDGSPAEVTTLRTPSKDVQAPLKLAGLRQPSPVVSRIAEQVNRGRLDRAPLHGIYDRPILLTSPLPLKVTSVAPRDAASALGTRPVRLFAGAKAALEDFVELEKEVPGDDEEAEQPKGVRTPLMTHQKQALKWMLWREEQTPQGGILADAMGLGKTLTVLSLIEQQRCKKRPPINKDDDYPAAGGLLECEATLVVCPVSLLHQWEAEAHSHLGNDWRVHVHHAKGRSNNPGDLAGCHLVVTTYDTLSGEWARASAGNKPGSPLFQLRWRRVVLDEAHSIRNMKTKRAKSACALESRSRWAVTGTPVHNDLNDMRSLLKFLQCSPFDDDIFWKRWISDHPGPDALAVVMKCLLLRRTKEQKGKDNNPLVPLPEKKVVLHRLQLEGTEAKVYQDLDEWSRSSGVEKYVDPVTKREMHRNVGSRRFVMLVRLQQACSHLSLLKRQALDDVETDADDLLADCMSGLSIANESVAGADRLDALNLEKYSGCREFDKTHVSCKIKVLLKLLTKVLDNGDSKDKSVVVSKWTSLLELVQEQLDQRGIPSVTIRGSVPGHKRAAYVHSFNQADKGPRVMLLSLEAGGVGLNLIGGNHMFVLDVHWNPALEAQAFDRIHRVGQTKTVYINRLICAGTIEERILELQRYKQRLAESVVTRRRLTQDDYGFLFDCSN